MRQILKTYNLELKVQGTVFVGNGEEIQKKEYVFLNGRHALGVVDIQSCISWQGRKGWHLIWNNLWCGIQGQL